MASSKQAYPLYPPAVVGAGAISPSEGAMFPEAGPAWIWGQGTPAAIAPFTTVQKGSIYSEVNAADDDPALWFKVDEGGDAADWVSVGNTGIIFVIGTLVDVSAGDSEQVVFHAATACQILEAGLMWEQGSGTVAGGDITIGSASGGGQHVTAANGAYTNSTTSGDYQALTLSTKAIAAGGSVFASHDIVAAAGEYRLLMKIRVEA
ncbi:hypothetical protein LCGC14_1869220 [marine sediment metagenome]|uniref:Uncharacterized protein n=1 Tax=marine sediment metagenome TaxID=412755 RepID=A0A0F9G5J8_9ZZZZ